MNAYKRNCLRCEAEMKKKNINTGGGVFQIEAKPGFFNGKLSTVSAFVCTQCGYVELAANNVEIFKEE